MKKKTKAKKWNGVDVPKGMKRLYGANGWPVLLDRKNKRILEIGQDIGNDNSK